MHSKLKCKIAANGFWKVEAICTLAQSDNASQKYYDVKRL